MKIKSKNQLNDLSKIQKEPIYDTPSILPHIQNNYSKQEIITQLQQRNAKLKQQVYKINEVFSNRPQQEKIQYQLYPSKTSEQALKHQLETVYQHIKYYEIQIKKLRNNGDVIFNSRFEKLNTIHKDKMNYIAKLKNELQQTIVSNIGHSKKLKDDFQKEQFQNTKMTLTKQIQYLKIKFSEIQKKEQIKLHNAKKQYDYIRSLERKLYDLGCSLSELQQIKQKVNNNIKITMEKQAQQSPKKNTLNIDDYLETKNQLKLLNKLKLDYIKKIQYLVQTKEACEAKNNQSRNKLIACQTEIESLQQQIKLLRSYVPKHKKPTRSLSVKDTTQIQIAKKVDKIKNVKIPQPLTHSMKFDQVGMFSENGQIFTDRKNLGNINYSKIISITVFINKFNQTIAGIHCIYITAQMKVYGGQYIKKDKEKNQIYYTIENFECLQGDYIKNIGGTLNSNNYIESLNITTKLQKQKQFGKQMTQQKMFTFDIGENQHPTCMFGSILIKYDNNIKKQVSMIENLGFEYCAQIVEMKKLSFAKSVETQI